MNNLIGEINSFYNNSIYYTDTDSLYIEKSYWKVSNKVGLVGSDLCQSKNGYKSTGAFYGMF